MTLNANSADGAAALKIVQSNTQNANPVGINLQMGTSAMGMGMIIQGTGSTTGGAVGTGKNHLTLWADVNSSLVKTLSVGYGASFTESLTITADGKINVTCPTSPASSASFLTITANNTNANVTALEVLNIGTSGNVMGMLIQGTGSTTGGAVGTGKNHLTLWANGYGSTVKVLSIGNDSPFTEKLAITAEGKITITPSSTANTAGYVQVTNSGNDQVGIKLTCAGATHQIGGWFVVGNTASCLGLVVENPSNNGMACLTVISAAASGGLASSKTAFAVQLGSVASFLSDSSNADVFVISIGGGITCTPKAVTSAVVPCSFTYNGAANTGSSASTERTDFYLNLARTVQWETGALTTQRFIKVTNPTMGFVGASTVTTAVTLDIGGAPIAGTNATITNAICAQFGGATTQVSAAGFTYANVGLAAHTLTMTGTTQVTSVGPSQLSIGILTITDASALTVNSAAALYIAGPPVAAGSVTLTAAYSIWVDDGAVRFDDRILGFQGADVTAANDTTLSKGNYFDITGATTINGIKSLGWTAGSLVTLQFDAAPLVKHNTAASAGFASILLAGAADFQASADDTLTLRYDGTYWREVSRTAI